MDTNRIGELAFIAGVIIAIIAGAASGVVAGYESTITLLLVVLGIIVGFLNITEKETTPFLVAAIALLAAGSGNLGAIPEVGQYISAILTGISSFVAPAAVIVALKAIYAIGSKK